MEGRQRKGLRGSTDRLHSGKDLQRGGGGGGVFSVRTGTSYRTEKGRGEGPRQLPSVVTKGS